MKKIDWKSRFKNKSWTTIFLTTCIAFVYQLLGMFGIVPSISESNLTEGVTLLMTILVGLGIVQDPTTPGIGDSDKTKQPPE